MEPRRKLVTLGDIFNAIDKLDARVKKLETAMTQPDKVKKRFDDWWEDEGSITCTKYRFDHTEVSEEFLKETCFYVWRSAIAEGVFS